MTICSICGKPTGWQGTITYSTAAGTYTTNAQFGSWDMCLGHGYTLGATSNGTHSMGINPMIKLDYDGVTPQRQPVPEPFYSAFKDDDKELNP